METGGRGTPSAEATQDGAREPDGGRGEAVRVRMARWFALLIALNIAVGMAYSVIALRRHADELHALELRAVEVASLTNQIEAAAWRGVGGDRTATRDLLLASEVLQTTTTELRAVDADVTELEALARSLAPLTSRTRGTAHLLSVTGGTERAATIASLNRSLGDTRTLARDTAAAYRVAGTGAARTADVESIIMMVLGALITGLLFRRFDSARRDADLRAARERAQGEARFRALVQSSSDVIAVLDADTTVRFVTPSVEHVLGRTPTSLVGQELGPVVHPDDVVPFMAAFDEVVRGGPGASEIVAHRWRHHDDGWKHAESVLTNLLDDPDVEGVVVNTRDVTERVALEDQLRHNAFHDPLTGLANRALFTDRVSHALALSTRDDGTGPALLFVDLNDFKAVNDRFGHAAGDLLLRDVAERLRACLRPADTVARLGGDEFGILLERSTSVEDGRRAAERIIEAFHQSFDVDGTDVPMRLSLGLAFGGALITDPDELLRDADVAMYAAKADRSGSGLAVYEPRMHEAILGRLSVGAELRRALERSEFVVHYQPIITLDDERVVGMEALVRWMHPDRGTVAPLDFIPVAEETGLIVPIGLWVLRQACADAAEWQTRYPSHPPGVSVNLSARQLQEPSLVEEVVATLRATGLPPHQLTLEITESLLVHDVDATVRRLLALKDLGVKVAIDDFGTGYSSLNHLERLPVDVLKIDKSFVDRVGSASTTDSVMVRAIVQLGRTLALRLVAEGIESAEQLTELRALACDEAQGYYFSRPVARDEAEAFLDRVHGLAPVSDSDVA